MYACIHLEESGSPLGWYHVRLAVTQMDQLDTACEGEKKGALDIVSGSASGISLMHDQSPWKKKQKT